MEEIVSKEKADELMKISGEIRGIVIKADAQFIERRKGKESLEKVEKEMERLGYPLKYDEIRAMGFYPIGLRTLNLLVIKQALNFSEKDIREMGMESAKVPALIRFFMKHFLQRKDVFFRKIPMLWKKFSTLGRLENVMFDERNRKLIVALKDFDVHPLYCLHIQGLFYTLLKIITGSNQVSCEETKCVYKGDECHEFLLKWE